MIDATSHPAFSPSASRRRARPRRALRIAAAVARSVLVPGSASPALRAREVQEMLVALERLPTDAVTGVYDRRTLDAVARFQASLGLAVDGVPDALTVDAMLRLSR